MMVLIDSRVKGKMTSAQPDFEEGKIDWNGKERSLHGGWVFGQQAVLLDAKHSVKG